jgi:hypothetical protein
MKTNRGLKILGAVLLFTLAFSTTASATILVDAGAGGFHAASTELPYIARSYVSLYNVDTVNSHWVQASLGFESTNQYFRGNTMILHMYGSGNGLQVTCYVYGVNVASGAIISGGGSSTSSTRYDVPISVVLPAGGAVYAMTATCFLPHAAGSVSELYGIGVGP